MPETLTGVWPSDVPPTLWNYHFLKAEEVPVLPLMSWHIEPNFAFAFAGGVVFICFFAWRRFKERSFDTESFDYRVIRELAPTELRGPSAMRRAYMIYVGVLLTLYVLMTFFGKLILQTAGSLPIAGTQVDMSSLNFSSPQWPLLLAFGFAGFAPMLPPLEIAETWLRQRAHRAVGIPVKIRQTTQKLVEGLDKVSTAGPRAKAWRSAPAWIPHHIGHRDSLQRLLQVADDLEWLLRWSRNDRTAPWPRVELRDKLRKLERGVAAEAEAALQEFDALLRQNYHEPPPSAERGAKRAPADALRSHQKRLELHLTTLVGQMETLRDEFASILSVYAERDPDFDAIADPELGHLLESTLAPAVGRKGPEAGLLVGLVPIFAAYALGTAFSVHPLLFSVERVPQTVLATAGLETLRFAALMWFPILAAFALRQFLADRGEWATRGSPHGGVLLVQQRMAALVVGCFVAAVALILLALLWAALVAINGARFQEILFGGKTPLMLFYPTQAGMVLLYLPLMLMAADAVSRRAGPWRLMLGLVNAGLVALFMAGHLYLWYRHQGCGEAPFLSDVLSSTACMQFYGGLDYVLYPLAAFLATSVFGAVTDKRPRPAPERPARRARPLPAASTVAGALALVILAAGSAFADPRPGGGADDGPKPIVVGFRADAEPFSYRIRIDGEDRFIGYVADLCYKLFAGGRYEVTSVAVNAADRFERVRQKDVPRPDAIDVLCDPVTLRFSEPEERSVGIFSPIVFASGVSYLYRRTRAVSKPVYIGYVDNSTAVPVAQRACEIDLLRVRGPNVSQDNCEAPRPASACPADPNELSAEGQVYRFCVMPSHDELVKWFCTPARGKDNSGQPRTELPVQVAYFGDRDLILGKLASWRAKGNDCPAEAIEQAAGNLTYEPYALIVTKTDAELVQHVQRRVYEFFSHQSEAMGLFATYFPGQQMSNPLAYLFLLNAVAEEHVFKRPCDAATGGKAASRPDACDPPSPPATVAATSLAP